MQDGTFARRLGAALLAGGAGAVLVEAYLFAVGLAAWPGTYQWIASAVRGSSAYAWTSTAWVGLGMHLGVSLGWALAFAAAATAWPRLLAHPLPSGLGYGVLVFVAMQAALALLGLWTAPSLGLLFHYLADHTVFFGLPLALVYRWAAGDGVARREATP